MPIFAKLQISHISTIALCAVASTVVALASASCDSGSSGGTGAGAATGTGTGGAPNNPTTSGGSGTETATSGTNGATTSTTASTGAGTVDCGTTPTGPVPALRLTQVARGLDDPLLALSAPGDNDRLFIVERGGTIRTLREGTVLTQPFLDISIAVRNAGGNEEHGLLGLSFHPNYAENGRFFVYYIHDDRSTTLAEYARSASNPDEAVATPVKTLFSLPFYGGNHFGGMLAFGPDGYLYVALGDHGQGSHAQDINDKRGKILRIDVDTYPTPPPGNLPNADPDVWSYGLRNPWRFSIDRCSGDMYIGDVGGAFEEINIDPGRQGHKNYGWSTVDTGTACSGATCPIAAYRHGSVSCSVTGGYVYRGSVIPGLHGRYLYGDWCSNEIWSFVWTGNAVTVAEDLSANLDTNNVLASIASFGEDTAGNLYVVDLLGGAVHRIDAE